MTSIASERIDPIPYCPDRFLVDLRRAALAIDAPFDEAKVAKSIKVFDAEFRRCVVQMKATCRAGAGLYYRFFYKWENDLTAVAQESGMLPRGSSPLLDLQNEVLSRYSRATRAGLDFDAGFGLAKVWTFTGGPVPISDLLALPSIPNSVRSSTGFFEKHGLKHVFFVASDFQQNSMNVYFGLEDECRNETWLRNMIDATGGAPDDDRLFKAMLRSLAVSAGVGMTYDYEGNRPGRWCIYGLNLPCSNPAAAHLMPRLPERLRKFRDEAPTLNVSPQFNVAWSFGPAGFYTKLEKSYSRDADYFLTVEMGGNLANPLQTTQA